MSRYYRNIDIHIYTYKHIHTRKYIYIYMYIYKFIRKYTNIWIDIHTLIYIH